MNGFHPGTGRIYVIRLARYRWLPYWCIGFGYGVLIAWLAQRHILLGIAFFMVQVWVVPLAHKVSEGAHAREIRRRAHGTTFL